MNHPITGVEPRSVAQASGLRPGEKLFEELLADDETTESTPHPKLRIACCTEPPADILDAVVQWMADAGAAPERHDLRAWLCQRVPEYRPQ